MWSLVESFARLDAFDVSFGIEFVPFLNWATKVSLRCS